MFFLFFEGEPTEDLCHTYESWQVGGAPLRCGYIPGTLRVRGTATAIDGNFPIQTRIENRNNMGDDIVWES